MKLLKLFQSMYIEDEVAQKADASFVAGRMLSMWNEEETGLIFTSKGF